MATIGQIERYKKNLGSSIGTLSDDSRIMMDGGKSISISELKSLLIPFKSYVALITQSGTENPTVVELYNSMGVEVTWERHDVGDYRATISGQLTDDKTTTLNGICNLTASKYAYFYEGAKMSVDTYCILTYDYTNTRTKVDSVLNNTLIEIRVYN